MSDRKIVLYRKKFARAQAHACASARMSMAIGVTAAMLLSLTACTTKQETGKAESGPVLTEEDTLMERSISSEDSLETRIEIVTGGCSLAEMGEFIEQDGLRYRVNSAYITKQKGGWTEQGWGLETDETGAVQENASYVVLNVTLVETEDIDFWWNSFELGAFTESNYDMAAFELIAVGTMTEETLDPDGYQADLPVGEEVTTDMVFYVEDGMLEDQAHLFLVDNWHGLALSEYNDPEDYSMVHLDRLEKTEH